MIRPMLSATLTDPNELKFPVMVSPKLDGLRCIMANGQALSRNLKPFRNQHVQKVLGSFGLDAVDGELIVGPPNGPHVLSATQSGIMSADGEPSFTYWLFDSLERSGKPFYQRFRDLDAIDHSAVKIVPHYWVEHLDEFISMEQAFINEGYEGIMIRGPHAPYKYGRATNSEHSLFKFKRFRDGEAIVTGIEEGTRNENEATYDPTGRSVRSSHQDNLKPAGRVGTILGRDVVSGQLLNISPGKMTMEMRRFYWEHPDHLVGAIIKFKTFDYGALDAPRFTTYQAHRSQEDMS